MRRNLASRLIGLALLVAPLIGAGETRTPTSLEELSRYLFLAGAVPYLILGTAHTVHTPRLRGERKGLSPADPKLADAMAESRVLLTDRTDMWRVWVGLNLSHSLGVVLLGVVVVLVGRTPATFAFNADIFLPLACIVSAVYLCVGLAYWFRTPIAWITLCTLLFASAWMLYLLRSAQKV